MQPNREQHFSRKDGLDQDKATYRGKELLGWCIGWEMPIGAKKPPIEEMPAIGTAIELKQ